MTRISEYMLARGVLSDIVENKEAYNKYSNEVSSGLKVSDPGDSKFSGSTSAYRETLSRLAGHAARVSSVQGLLSFQDNVVSQASELVVRAKELAAQMANETVGVEQRAQTAKEIFEIRDHLISLANSKYQGKFIYNGANDNKAPYTEYDAFAASAADNRGYNLPALNADGTVPAAAKHYVYGYPTPTSAGTDSNSNLMRSVFISDDVSVQVNTAGDKVFGKAVTALEDLGRCLAGYVPSSPYSSTTTSYNLPVEVSKQTKDIQAAMDLLDTARQSEIMPERVSLGARLRRLETAESMIGLTKTDAEEVLADLQNADLAESGTKLTEAQNALEASYTVSARILRLSILDYL